MTNAASTYTLTLSAKPNSGGTATIGGMEHYITLVNTNASDKTLVIQLDTTGYKKVSENRDGNKENSNLEFFKKKKKEDRFLWFEKPFVMRGRFPEFRLKEP